VNTSLAQVGAPLKLNDESAPSILTAGVWSPAGDSIAFVSPTKRIQALRSDEASAIVSDPANAPARAVGVSVNEIWVYHLQQEKWSKISDDGGRPRFSNDGKRLFYLSSSKGARAVDMTTLADESLGAPDAGDPNKRFSTEILSDGSVLSPDQPHGVLKQVGALETSWAAIELAPQDEVRIAPNEQRIAVIYNASEKSTESAVVVYDKAGQATTVFKNCPDAALHMAWSQDGNSLVYAIRATGQPEVWESKLSAASRPTVRLRLTPTQRIGALSLSPDNKSIAFSQTGHTGREGIWIANKSGMQRIATGLLGNWSPQGDQILYAVRRSGGGFDWYVVPVKLPGN
jgi:Tol biopolymer transport system component